MECHINGLRLELKLQIVSISMTALLYTTFEELREAYVEMTPGPFAMLAGIMRNAPKLNDITLHSLHSFIHSDHAS